jgi:hypothetical protein
MALDSVNLVQQSGEKTARSMNIVFRGSLLRSNLQHKGSRQNCKELVSAMCGEERGRQSAEDAAGLG